MGGAAESLAGRAYSGAEELAGNAYTATEGVLGRSYDPTHPNYRNKRPSSAPLPMGRMRDPRVRMGGFPVAVPIGENGLVDVTKLKAGKTYRDPTDPTKLLRWNGKSFESLG